MHLSTSSTYNLSTHFMLTVFYWILTIQYAGFNILKVKIQSSILESTLFNSIVHLSKKHLLIAQFAMLNAIGTIKCFFLAKGIKL